MLDDSEAPAGKNLNVRALIATEAVLRILRLAVGSPLGDFETIAVYLAVVTAGSGRILRDPELLAQYGDTQTMPEEERLGVSRRAIAESLGLPRETVRRKIVKLIERGAVIEQDGLVKAKPPIITPGRSRDLALAVIREFERAAALLQRYPDT